MAWPSGVELQLSLYETATDEEVREQVEYTWSR